MQILIHLNLLFIKVDYCYFAQGGFDIFLADFCLLKYQFAKHRV